MFERDILVAGVAFGLGFMILYTVLFNEVRCFENPLAQNLNRRFGRSDARRIILGTSLMVIFLGFYILTTAFMNRSNGQAQTFDSKSLLPQPTGLELSTPDAR